MITINNTSVLCKDINGVDYTIPQSAMTQANFSQSAVYLTYKTGSTLETIVVPNTIQNEYISDTINAMAFADFSPFSIDYQSFVSGGSISGAVSSVNTLTGDVTINGNIDNFISGNSVVLSGVNSVSGFKGDVNILGTINKVTVTPSTLFGNNLIINVPNLVTQNISGFSFQHTSNPIQTVDDNIQVFNNESSHLSYTDNNLINYTIPSSGNIKINIPNGNCNLLRTGVNIINNDISLIAGTHIISSEVVLTYSGNVNNLDVAYFMFLPPSAFFVFNFIEKQNIGGNSYLLRNKLRYNIGADGFSIRIIAPVGDVVSVSRVDLSISRFHNI